MTPRDFSAVVLAAVVLGGCRGSSSPPPEVAGGDSRPDRTWQSPLVRELELSRMASPDGARCVLRGTARIDREIFAGPTGQEAIADTFGHPFNVEVRALAPRGSERILVRLRSVEQEPSVSIEGWLESYVVPLQLTRDVPVAGDHVWFSRGTPVRVLAGNGERARLRADNGCYGDFGLGAETDCSALELVPPNAPGVPYVDRQFPHHTRRASLSLFDHAGRLVLELGYGDFDVVERRGDLARVERRDAIRIAGWVRSSELEAGAEPDTDDCGPGIRERPDSCPDDPETGDTDGCPEVDAPVGELAREVPLREGPSADAKVIGIAERGLRARVRKGPTPLIPEGLAMLAPEASAIGPPVSQWGFWVLAKDVE